MLFFVAFFAVALVVVGLIHWYLWRRLVRATTRPGRGRRIGTVILVVLALQMVAAILATRVVAHSQERILAWTGYLWLALMFYLLVALAVLEVPTLVVRLWLRRRRPVPARMAVAPVSALVGAARQAAPSVRMTTRRAPPIPAPWTRAGDCCWRARRPLWPG